MKQWRLAGRGAAALAGGMGIGRFAYTPILPLMHSQAGLSPRLGAALATANYTGYLAGALAAVVVPRLLHSRWALRLSLLILAATLAGTFLVAAINETASGPIGNSAWIVVGLAAVPSTALWARLGRRWSRSALLLVALLVQAVGIVLPAVLPSVAAALVSAALFGATFLGVANLAIALGTELRVPHAVAILTTGYSLGQIVGPLAVGPLLHNGYHQALLVSAGVVALAAIAAHPLRRIA